MQILAKHPYVEELQLWGAYHPPRSSLLSLLFLLFPIQHDLYRKGEGGLAGEGWNRMGRDRMGRDGMWWGWGGEGWGGVGRDGWGLHGILIGMGCPYWDGLHRVHTPETHGSSGGGERGCSPHVRCRNEARALQAQA